jgi:beta-galactosidase GanA
VIVPTLLNVAEADAARLRAVPERGGSLLVTYLSGVCDDDGQVITGGFPGAFREVLGAWSDEFYPLQERERVDLDDGAVVADWTERVHLDGAEPVIAYTSSSLAGGPAVTRNAVGEGAAWYVSAPLPSATVDRLALRLADEAALPRTAAAEPGLEAMRRVGPDRSYLFLLNHTGNDRKATAAGHDLLADTPVGPVVTVPAGGVRVLRETP